MPIKDSQYWQVYNQKKKEYLAHKARERRAKEKGIQPAERIQPLASERIQLESIQPSSERIQPNPPYTTERIQPIKPEERIQPQLWSHHHSVKKPYCHSCFQAGIKESQSAFCSLQKIKDALSIRLPNRYVCNVYHWTLYQGQGKIKHEM